MDNEDLGGAGETKRGQRIIPIRTLQRVLPYSRNPQRRGAMLLPPLRRQLMQDDIETIDELEFRVARCIAIQAGTTDLYRTQKMARALSQRFGKEIVQGPLAQALVHLRSVDSARQLTLRGATGSIEGEEQLARLAMLDGDPAAGLMGYRHMLRMALDQGADRRTIRRPLEVLIESGDFGWLAENVPDDVLAASPYRRAQLLAPSDGTLPILCLNLDKDSSRFDTTAAMIGAGGRLDRVPAILGAMLPVSQRRRLLGNSQVEMTAAEIGCSLSHVAAWERLAASLPDDDYALVIEDDARFIYGPGRGAVELVAAARGAGADLLFVNMRACLAATRAAPYDGGPVGVFPVDGAFPHEALMTNPGWGGDGYLLSGRGARLLVAAWSETGLLGALDWQMCLMCFEELPDVMRNIHTVTPFDALRHRGSWPRLPGYICNLPIIHTRDFGFSAINAG